jgi:protease II
MVLYKAFAALVYNLELLVWLGAVVVLLSYNFDVDLIQKIREFLNSQGKEKEDADKVVITYPLVEGVIDTDKTLKVHGKSINNPQAVLEDLKDPKVTNWIQSELDLTEEYSKTHLTEIRKKFTHAYKNTNNFEGLENPIHFGSTYFFYKRLRPEIPQYSLFATNNLDVEAKLVFDPNTIRFSHMSTITWDDEDPSEGMIYIHATWISLDGYKIAYGYSSDLQSRLMNIKVRDLKTGKDLPEVITNCFVDYTNVTWLESRTGFFYTTQCVYDPAAATTATSSGTVPTKDSSSSNNTTNDEKTPVQSTRSPFGATTVHDNEHPVPNAAKSAERKISNRVFFHPLNHDPESHDFLVFETLNLHDNVIVNTHVTNDAHYLLIDIFKKKRDLSCNSLWRETISEHASASSIGNKVYYFDLTKFDAKNSITLGYCYKFIDTFAYRFDYISNIEDDFWFRTNFKAPNYRVVRITLPDFSIMVNNLNEDEQTEMSSRVFNTSKDYSDTTVTTLSIDSINFKFLHAWKGCLDWIPQRLDGDYLESASIAAHTVLVLKYLKNCSHEVLLYDLTQNLVQESQIPVADLPHPPFGTIIGPHCNFYSSEIFYQYSSFSDPSSVYRAVVQRDPFNGSIEISFHQVNSTEIPGLDKYHYETIQEFCETKRNVYVPILRFGIRSNLENITPSPCIVYVNGGFGITATPTFSLPFVLFADHCDGITVLTNIQGSGIYGTDWAQNGSKANKENCINDLQSVLKFIVDKKYSTPEQIVLIGGTFNGYLLGTAIASFPHMFSTAIIMDGIFDLVNHHLFNPPIYATLYNTTPSNNNSTSNTIADEDKLELNTAELWKYSIWTQEFGCILESEEEMNRIMAISPVTTVQNLLTYSSSNSRYPAVLLFSGL